jgi:hypothetical protein
VRGDHPCRVEEVLDVDQRPVAFGASLFAPRYGSTGDRRCSNVVSWTQFGQVIGDSWVPHVVREGERFTLSVNVLHRAQLPQVVANWGKRLAATQVN